MSEFSLQAQTLFRAAYGTLLMATLLMTLPHSRRFFLSERYGGYAVSSPWTDRIQHPTVLPFIQFLWFLSAAMILFGYHPVLFGFINLLLCRYYFISMRWRGLLRGMGAPGFIAYWLSACVFFLEFTQAMDPSGDLRSLALLLFRLDFAVIFISAGLYKLLCGYPKNEGMEYGMVNPLWGYWSQSYRWSRPNHTLFRTLNHLAYVTEIGAGLLLIFPLTRIVGAALLFLTFLFIATQIRLGFLCEMVMVIALLYIDMGTPADRIITSFMPSPRVEGGLEWAPMLLNQGLYLAMWLYIILLPLAHIGLYYNFLSRSSLPGMIQRALEIYTNFFGMIIWRVFSVDIVNFFVTVYIQDAETGVKRLYSRLGAIDWPTRYRYLHVGESICLASIFTTLKYYPSNPGLFRERLLRYARTIPHPGKAVLVFEYNGVVKSEARFEFIPIAEYLVDVSQGTVDERIIDQRFSPRAVHTASPVHEGAYPGSYAPLKVP